MDTQTQHTNTMRDESCWNTIGVWGARSGRCNRLVEFTHCMNCPVFAAAGSSLLDREFPAGYAEEWTQFLARGTESVGTARLSVVVFRLAGELLALPTKLFKEIVEPRPIHGIPHRSDNILLGLTNIHGQLQLCFSLKALLGISDADSEIHSEGSTAKMLVVETERECFVFQVDSVISAGDCRMDDAGNVPATISKAAGTYTTRILRCGQKEVGLLDDGLLLYALKRRMQ